MSGGKNRIVLEDIQRKCKNTFKAEGLLLQLNCLRREVFSWCAKGILALNSIGKIYITDQLIREVHLKMLGLVDTSKVSNVTGQDEDHINLIFDLVKDEAKQTLQLLRGMSLPMDARILEVGAGYGLASICFAMMGFSVTALEPGGTGFEDYVGTSSAFAQMCGVEIEHLESGAETACFANKPLFDLIISNNVLEHVHEIDRAISNLATVLKRDGIMVHSCPNYSFPYEPHFGLLLVPFFPAITKYFLPKRIRKSSLWNSLNFITARRAKKMFQSNGLCVRFRKGTMTTGIFRVRNEKIFAARHQKLHKLFSIDIIYGITRRILRVPVLVASPMDILVCYPEQQYNLNIHHWLLAQDE